MKKTILTTVFSGYNYGSCLQAFAGKIILKEMGYECDLIALKSLIKGRDIRFKKLIVILFRSLILRGKNGTNALNTYKSSYKKTMIGDSKSCFKSFIDKYISPVYLSWGSLEKLSKECVACIAGSDQIWNSSTMYVDPLYYLRYAPSHKRVALAPSFGRDFIADYNKNKMRQWISDFAHLSVREDSGVGLIKDLTGRQAIQLVDPTLMLDGESWKRELGINDKAKDYILAYFLDKPSDSAKLTISKLKESLNCKVIAIPYLFEEMSYCDNVVPSGPIEFVDLINNARCVLTDSFHGTAFSINLHTPFYVFGREYGTAHSQNSRVESILRNMNMQNRFEPKNPIESLYEIDFEYSENVLASERDKARKYLRNALQRCEIG